MKKTIMVVENDDASFHKLYDEVLCDTGYWRKRALVGIKEIFKRKQEKSNKENQKLVDELYRQIGKLKVENERFKKKSVLLENWEEKESHNTSAPPLT